MQQELAYKVMDVELHQLGSEEFIPEPGTLDLCFTSPPYFDTEKYSTEPTQSYIKYPTKDTWLNGFMAKTLENCSIGLKSTGLLAINIANVKTYPTLEADFVSMATSHGWRLERTMFLALSRIMGTKVQGEKFKHEPIFIFSKI